MYLDLCLSDLKNHRSSMFLSALIRLLKNKLMMMYCKLMCGGLFVTCVEDSMVHNAHGFET